MASRRRIAIYPGSFDPVTNGHVDIVHRATRLFDHVIVAVAENSAKNPHFTTDQRLSFLKLALKPLIRQRKISVETFQGLLVHYAERRGAAAILRGLRAVSDFEYEFQMALMNRRQAPRIETVYLMPDEKFTYISSTMIKEISRLGGDIAPFVPKAIVPAVRNGWTPVKN